MNQESYDIKLLLFMGIAGMSLLFISLLLIFIISQRKKYEYLAKLQLLRENQQNQLIEAAIRSEEKERHRIAEALHDEVGAFLSSSKLHFEGMTIDTEQDHNIQLYEKGKELLDEAISKVRGISHSLHSSVLKELGLNYAIRHFTEKIALGKLIVVTTHLDDRYRTPDPEHEISIYRLIQELINNILKHAQAKHIEINSVLNSSSVVFKIVHNGNGLSQQQFEELRYKKDGLGLKNIQNRIILLRGRIHFSREAGEYHITLEIPVHSV